MHSLVYHEIAPVRHSPPTGLTAEVLHFAPQFVMSESISIGLDGGGMKPTLMKDENAPVDCGACSLDEENCFATDKPSPDSGLIHRYPFPDARKGENGSVPRREQRTKAERKTKTIFSHLFSPLPNLIFTSSKTLGKMLPKTSSLSCLMAENDGAASKTTPPPRPTISLPPRSAVESIFARGADASPGPMTLVSSFFSENDPESECRSFSQLLAGAMASPGAIAPRVPSSGTDASENLAGDRDAGAAAGGLRFKQNRPFNLVIAQSPMFTVPPGLSPASLLDSPGFFSPGQGHFGMSHQQALAQVTAQAVQSQSHNQGGYASSVPTGTITSALPVQPAPLQQLQPISNPKTLTAGSFQMSQSEQRSQATGPAVDKPADDGYNWRKYGQKQVKGSEYPRSYYKCTHPNCPVKKKVERSVDGHVTEIIYKGQHNHPKPQPSKRAKEGAVLPSAANEINGSMDSLVNPESVSVGHPGNVRGSNEGTGTALISRQDQESGHATTEQLSVSSDGEEVGDTETRTDERDNKDEPDPKRRNLETTAVATRVIESAGSHKTVTEPRIVVQTTSEVDLLDDGYRWRKYGQKVVKGNPHPRSYYKCTTAGCNVRKHVERASNDSKSVITTYEGKHNHEVPASKHSSHNMINTSLQSKLQSSTENKNGSLSQAGATNGNQQVVSLVRTKEERDIT
ncbi:hypothetical protein H6P81_019855 [Aristolochia fimbriata]|uniref:WRKY domain-containing protein n=1 Tax=Aristolochia fimbriata TaxID=158543 RepID=A0AAV7DUQ4_ARIFI|nr:hypothetical protein H6P81_019855 [Aristolochia fimbriata]